MECGQEIRGWIAAQSSDRVVLRGETKGDPDAPEILFVHGLRQSRLCWERQFRDPRLDGFRLVRFDLRGHGDSDKPDVPQAYADVDLWADDVASIIHAAGLRRPVLVGWSMGGFVVGAYLRKFGAAQVAGVNLVDPIVKRSLELLGPDAASFTESTSSRDLAIRARGTADFLTACFHRPPPREEFDRMLVINGMTTRAVMEGSLQNPFTDMSPVFGAYPGPILLTHGVHDHIVRLAMTECVKALRPDSELSLYEDSGHSPFIEEPDRFGRELAAFVSNCASASPASFSSAKTNQDGTANA